MNAGPTPVSVKVLSIIGIVWSILTLILSGIGLALIGMKFGPPNPAVDDLSKDGFYIGFSIVDGIIGMGIALMLLLGSIGSLTLKRWGRSGMILYAWLAILNTLASTAFSMGYAVPKMYDAASRGGPVGTAQGVMIGGIIGGGCGLIFGMALPICILIFFNKAKVKDAFNGIFPETVGNFPVDYQNPPQQWQ